MSEVWRIGDVTISRLVEREGPKDFTIVPQATPAALKAMPWLFPHFVTDDFKLIMSNHLLLVEAPGIRLVVDTCYGNDKNRGFATGGVALKTDILERMATMGWPRESVDTVLCTHLHLDHVGWNTVLGPDGTWIPTFPNARYLVGRVEYEHWVTYPEEFHRASFDDSVRPVMDAGLMDMVEMDHVLTPEIRLTPTIGHTPGHVSVVIESKGERAIITGDMLHHPCQFGHPEWSPDFDADKGAAHLTRAAKMGDWADKPILVIGTHFPTPTAGRVKRDGKAFRFEV